MTVTIHRCMEGREGRLPASGCWLMRVCTQDPKDPCHTESRPGTSDLEMSQLETQAGSRGVAPIHGFYV